MTDVHKDIRPSWHILFKDHLMGRLNADIKRLTYCALMDGAGLQLETLLSV
jgi:hypothetical protein